MEICNVQEFINMIEFLGKKYKYTKEQGTVFEMEFKPHFIFRGHADHEQYKLLPRIFREKVTERGRVTQYSQLEYNIISDFIAEAKRWREDGKNMTLNRVIVVLEYL